MTVDYEAEFSGEEAYEAEYVAAAVKPELTGRATPSWEAQTLYPDPGCVFARVEIDGMPEPTETVVIDSNGEHHVERAGIADVRVPQGVFPAGTLQIGENGTYDVSGYAEAAVDVSADPEVGVAFGDFTANGLPQTVRTVGMTALPSWCFYLDNRYNRTLFLSQVKTLLINEGVTTLTDSCARGLKTMTRVVLPSTLRTIQANAFLEDAAVAEYDFSACAAVPTLATAASLAHAAGCVFKVPEALLPEWQAANGWRDLTGVMWQGV